MAKVKLNPVVEQVRGGIGDLIFKRYGEDVIVARKADTADRPWSEAQLASREHFRQAALYGKLMMADPAMKALYDEADAATRRQLSRYAWGEDLTVEQAPR